MKLKSDGTELFYDVRGSGPPVVLLHPFPLNHHFWDKCAPLLEQRYKIVLPDLRGHGDSAPGDGPALIEKHAQDVARLCDELGISKAVFAGVSIGGYILFEFWRQSRERVAALVLANTRAGAETAGGRANRQKSIESVQQRGPSQFIEELLPRLVSKTTLETRLDVVEGARKMMSRMSVQGIVANLQGMMVRPDSIPTLKTINVPTLIIAGEEDTATPLVEAEVMKSHIANSRLEVVPRAGHYAAFEQPEFAGKLLRSFLDQAALSLRA
jgi:pimeloyl-ACP methyl ester carboxylesterase